MRCSMVLVSILHIMRDDRGAYGNLLMDLHIPGWLAG